MSNPTIQKIEANYTPVAAGSKVYRIHIDDIAAAITESRTHLQQQMYKALDEVRDELTRHLLDSEEVEQALRPLVVVLSDTYESNH